MYFNFSGLVGVCVTVNKPNASEILAFSFSVVLSSSLRSPKGFLHFGFSKQRLEHFPFIPCMLYSPHNTSIAYGHNQIKPAFSKTTVTKIFSVAGRFLDT